MVIVFVESTCDEYMCKPLGIILRSCLENGKFPSQWKKANVVPFFKKKKKKKQQKPGSKYLSPDFFTACFK